ncbi:hypothetical protein [Sphingobium sp. TKS]|uniref:hypothetical protein n=1 Tax=Sphingobium sp. TKS TaxID=1315974 RepID=UPI00077059FF|nr:hypothetical protein [Sphingobium sp. TKS]AMK26129.1 hypothetical protein K426_26150 [Sphingobium sp. TKS]
MIENDIKALVEEHYKDPKAGLLLLSQIGMQLTEAGLWPSAHDKRTLYDAVEATAAVKAVRDDDAKSFIAVVLAGDEQRAIRAIDDRRKRHFLRGLPRALLLAFTLATPQDQIMSVLIGHKITYSVGPELAEGAIRVDEDLRLPGLTVMDIAALGDEEVEQIDTRVRAWCERHNIDPASLARMPAKPGPPAPAPSFKGSSALERLYAAQDPDVAKRLTVPIDIALALSRMH